MPMLAVATMSWPSSDTGTASASWMRRAARDRKSTRLNSSHDQISYAVFCLKKKILRRHKKSLEATQRRSGVIPGHWPMSAELYNGALRCFEHVSADLSEQEDQRDQNEVLPKASDV